MEEETEMNHLYTRVSIRKYQDRPVEKEKTEAILRAAMQAPSAANQQPWEFYLLIVALQCGLQFGGITAYRHRNSADVSSGHGLSLPPPDKGLFISTWL